MHIVDDDDDMNTLIQNITMIVSHEWVYIIVFFCVWHHSNSAKWSKLTGTASVQTIAIEIQSDFS